MLVVVRHAITPHNVMIDGRGSAELTAILERAAAKGMYEKNLMLLLRGELRRNYQAENHRSIVENQGRAQCDAVKKAFANDELTFKACLCSPYRRTIQTAAAIVGRFVKYRTYEELCERDLGIFYNLPRDLFYRFFPQEARKKARDPLGWKPFDGCSLRELWPALQSVVRAASEIVKTRGNVLIVAHADVNVSLRALPELGAMTTTQLLHKGPGDWNPLWFQNCQYDKYSFGDPNGGRPWNVPTHFRSVVPYGADLGGTKLDTGWHEIKR